MLWPITYSVDDLLIELSKVVLSRVLVPWKLGPLSDLSDRPNETIDLFVFFSSLLRIDHCVRNHNPRVLHLPHTYCTLYAVVQYTPLCAAPLCV
jgi:hypothetical protein